VHYSTDSVAPKPAEAHTHRANSELRCPNCVHRLRTRYHYLFIGARAPPSLIDRLRRCAGTVELTPRARVPYLNAQAPAVAAHNGRRT